MSYGFFTLLSVVFFVTFIYLLCVHLFFRIYQELEKNTPMAGDVVRFHFLLKNEFFFGFAGIRVRFFKDFSVINGLSDEMEYELIPRTGIEKQTELICKYRGEYEVGIRAVEIQDYFRLFTVSFPNHETLRVTVKPKIVELSELRAVDLSRLMARDSDRGSDSPDVLTRKYEAGDDPRQIHWKASARSRELLVRIRVGEEQEGISILMGAFRKNAQAANYLPAEDKILEIVIAWVLLLVKKQIPVTICYPAGSGENIRICEKTVADMEHFGNFYEEISTVEFREDLTDEFFSLKASTMPDLLKKKAVFLILQQWSEQVNFLLTQLQGSEIYTLVYLLGDQKTNVFAAADGAKNQKIIQFTTDTELLDLL